MSPARRKSTKKRRPAKGVSAPKGRKIDWMKGTPDCKHFSGYKPCFPGTSCIDGCVEHEPIGTKILIVNLDAMGNVLVTTTMLPALKRKYPKSRIYWITLKNAYRLLDHNPLIDRVYLWEPESWLVLQGMEFDLVLNVDKSQRSGAFTQTLRAKKKLGFGISSSGAIMPLNREAVRNYLLGLDDHAKFRVNTKTVVEMLREQFVLDAQRDEYILEFSPEEKAHQVEMRKVLGLAPPEEPGRPLVVGFNTGCSELYPNKKMTIDQHVRLIERLSAMEGIECVLLGGPEDTERNEEIMRRVGGQAISTPTREGVRHGLMYVDLCDVVISGDSFGMHAAIARKKNVIVWFGVSCPQEIELYGRGMKLIPAGLECSPCWKRQCPYRLECIQMIDLDAIVAEVDRVKQAR